jgi:PilZ domain
MRERRAAPRYRLDLPIVVRRAPTLRENDVLNGRTRNISAAGIYFTMDQRLAVDEVVDFSLTFARLVEGADILVKGRARVLRMVQTPETISERLGVAAVIENFHILSA